MLLHAFVQGFQELINPINMAALVAGVVAGSILGFIPGLNGIVGVALLLPFMTLMPPEVGLPLMIGMVAVVTTSDSIPAVLIGTPGTAGSQATIMDGFPMGQNGEAGKALGAAFFVSGVGGVFGAAVLSISVPIFKPLVLSFGVSEFLAMGILGLSMVSALAGRDPPRGLIAAGMGILLSLIGQDPINAIGRWTLGTPYLLDGVDLGIMALGLFSIPEITNLCVRGTQIIKDSSIRIEDKFSGIKESMRHKRLIFGSATIGALIGFLPGMGTVVANWIAYTCAMMFCKPNDKFGKGDIRGVIAPESANNAAFGGALIPTLAFGIPGSTVTALMLAALWAQGITPGESLLTTKVHLVYLIIWSLAIANIIGAFLSYIFTNQIARLGKVHINILAPIILVPIFAGALMSTNSMADVLTLIGIGILGWVMVYLDWPRPPMVLGFVLGHFLERNYFKATMVYGDHWVYRPIVLVILALAAAGIFLGVKLRPKDNGDQPPAVMQRPKVHLAFNFALIVVLALALYQAVGWPHDTKLFPVAIGLVTFVLSIDVFARDVYRVYFSGAQIAADEDAEFIENFNLRASVRVLLWLCGFSLAIWVLGFYAAALIFVFLFVWLNAREKIGSSLIYAAATVGCIYVLFVVVLQQLIYPGLVQSYFFG
jgi:putative tricarboxylic transport membrane protein